MTHAILALTAALLGVGCSSFNHTDATGAYESSDSAASEPSQNGGIIPEAGQLTAAEWNDLDNWDFWRQLFEAQGGGYSEQEAKWGFFTAQRYPVDVFDGDQPMVDVAVALLDCQGEALWRARTDNHGRAELFDGLFDDSDQACQVRVDGAGTFDVGAINEPLLVDLCVDDPPMLLDLMLVVDTTGSMSDELSYLQSELGSVVRRVQDEHGQALTVRLSVNFYRDHGDDYVVRSFPFTEDLDQAVKDLMRQSAAGGGDKPEALDEAVFDGVFDHHWSESARARLLIPVMDAPAHQSQENLAALQDSAVGAAERGIQIVPVAASGADVDTEFSTRFLEVASNGTYVFLTDDSGIGNEHREPTVGQYEVELFNDLLVRVINESLE